MLLQLKFPLLSILPNIIKYPQIAGEQHYSRLWLTLGWVNFFLVIRIQILYLNILPIYMAYFCRFRAREVLSQKNRVIYISDVHSLVPSYIIVYTIIIIINNTVLCFPSPQQQNEFLGFPPCRKNTSLVFAPMQCCKIRRTQNNYQLF